jgi:signal transduction histidine kinase
VKHLSIRWKITLWFSIALIVVVSMTYGIVLAVSEQVIQKTIRDNLIETVEHNYDEIEFYTDIDDVDLKNDVDHFVRYGDGYLEVDDDFLDQVNEVYTALYQEDGTLIYGENPVARDTAERDFQNAVVQKQRINGTLYYIFDRELSDQEIPGLWLRGVVAETQGAAQLQNISKLSLIVLPLVVLLAVVGGFVIASRALRPIRQIEQAANRISHGGDLKQRIDIGKGGDELHRLANRFNEMFERLDASFEAERQFTSDASHELRTPMSVILAQCEYSLEEDCTKEEYREAMRVIHRQSKRMSRLINDMLTFTRLENRANRYPMAMLDFGALVLDTCEDLALIEEHGIKLDCQAQTGVLLCGNRQLLIRMLTNLVSNAYRYGKDHGHIWVSLKEHPDALVLAVRDDGIGILSEDLPQIFRRFYQADSSRSSGGTGLGLSMVQGIVELHGGRISVESVYQKGSTFTVTLPKPGKE